MDKGELRQRCLNVIEERQDEIIALGRGTYKTPELGCKEFRTGKLMEEAFRKLGLEPETGVSYTGCHVFPGPRGNNPKVAVIGELGCIMYGAHPDAAEGGLVHACGHNIWLANLRGTVLGILTSGVIEHLGSAAGFIAIPVEECVDYEYRDRPMSQGAIRYLEGKQELMYHGGLDDTDMILQYHMMKMEPGKCYILNTKGSRFVSKIIHFLGGVTHAGFAPEQGINTLNMAELAMSNTHVPRETFRDEDKVRMNIVIEEGGGLVDVVPERVVTEIVVYVLTIDAIEDTSHRVNRSIKATTTALGDKMEIHDYIDYLPLNTDHRTTRLYRGNMITYEHAGEGVFTEDWETTGSTDLGGISQIMPCIHIWTSGIKDGLHTEKYRIDSPYAAYIVPARMMTPTVIDLLWDGDARGKEIMGDFRPTLTKGEYLNLLKDRQVADLYNALDLQSI